MARTGALICAVAIALAAGCKGKRKPERAPELAATLFDLAGTDDPTRTKAVTSWTLSRDEWNRTVTEPYRPLYDEYVKAVTAARPTLIERFAKSRTIVVRAHFAGDPAATYDQAITRWALPTLAESKIAELGGTPPVPIDAVFVDAGGHWRALVGIGAIVRHQIAARDASCAASLDHIEPAGGRCIEAAWGVADAALRDDRARFAQACGLAATLCGKRSQ